MRRAALAISFLLAGGCAVVLGVGTVGYGELDAGVSVDASDATPQSDATADTSIALDGSGDVDAAPPSFCKGITFYAPFEGSAISFDEQPARLVGGTTYTDAGLVGKALRVAGDQQIGWDLLFAGERFATTTRGSLALWVRAAAEPLCDFSVDGGTGYGVLLADNAPHIALPHLSYEFAARDFNFQLAGALPDGAPRALPNQLFVCPAIVYWHPGAFNQLTATWREGVGGSLSLNGGERPLLTTLTATTAWKSQDDASRYELDFLGPHFDADYDELVFWNRELTADEILALYHAQWPSGRAIRDLCPCAAGVPNRCADAGGD